MSDIKRRLCVGLIRSALQYIFTTMNYVAWYRGWFASPYRTFISHESTAEKNERKIQNPFFVEGLNAKLRTVAGGTSFGAVLIWLLDVELSLYGTTLTYDIKFSCALRGRLNFYFKLVQFNQHRHITLLSVATRHNCSQEKLGRHDLSVSLIRQQQTFKKSYFKLSWKSDSFQCFLIHTSHA